MLSAVIINFAAADNNFDFFLIYRENKSWHSIHRKSQDFFSLINRKNKLECCLLQILLGPLSVHSWISRAARLHNQHGEISLTPTVMLFGFAPKWPRIQNIMQNYCVYQTCRSQLFHPWVSEVDSSIFVFWRIHYCRLSSQSKNKNRIANSVDPDEIMSHLILNDTVCKVTCFGLPGWKDYQSFTFEIYQLWDTHYSNKPKYWYRQAWAKIVDPDQMSQNAASDQGLHCLRLIQHYFRHCHTSTGSKIDFFQILEQYVKELTFTTLWAFSADDRLMIFFLFFPENRIWHFMQIVSLGDNLHEMSYPVFWEK